MKAVKKTTIKKLDNSAVKLAITVSGKKTRENYDSLLVKYAKEAQIKGFRKGKVPTHVLETKFGESIKSETYYNLIEEAVKEALEKVETKPLPMSTPTLMDEEKLSPVLDKDFTFSIKYDVYPEVEISNYEGISVEVPEVKLGKAELDEELKKVQEQNAMMIDKSEGTVAENDSLTVNYCELDDKGDKIAETAGEDFSFTVGSEYSPYKMDKDVIGMKKDETKVIEKSFAKDDSDEKLAGRDVKVEVTITSIKEKDIPKLDDELAQDVNEEFKTLDDLKKDLQTKLNEQLENKKKEITHEQIFDTIIEATPIDLPASMIQAELDNNLQNFARQMGMEPKQLLSMLGKGSEGPEALFEEWRPSTIKNLKKSIILDTIAKDQNFEISDEEVDAEYDKIAKANDKEVSEIKDYYIANNAVEYIKSDIKSKKAMDVLVDKASIKKGKKISFLELMENK